MTTATTTTITWEDDIAADAICYDDDVRDALVHAAGPDCARLHGLRIVRRECSVCGQEWGTGSVSQHEGCAILSEDGDRRYADCLAVLSDGSELRIA